MNLGKTAAWIFAPRGAAPGSVQFAGLDVGRSAGGGSLARAGCLSAAARPKPSAPAVLCVRRRLVPGRQGRAFPAGTAKPDLLNPPQQKRACIRRVGAENIVSTRERWPAAIFLASKIPFQLSLARRFGCTANAAIVDCKTLRQNRPLASTLGGTLFYCVVSLYCIAFSAKVLFTITSCGAVFSSSPAAVITVCSKSKLSCVSTGSVLYAPMSL